jgi:hypothetical protein
MFLFAPWREKIVHAKAQRETEDAKSGLDLKRALIQSGDEMNQ